MIGQWSAPQEQQEKPESFSFTGVLEYLGLKQKPEPPSKESLKKTLTLTDIGGLSGLYGDSMASPRRTMETQKTSDITSISNRNRKTQRLTLDLGNDLSAIIERAEPDNCPTPVQNSRPPTPISERPISIFDPSQQRPRPNK